MLNFWMSKLRNGCGCLLLGLLLMVVLPGCLSLSERPADVTIDELEVRMTESMDPEHEYRDARAYLQRQNITEHGFWKDRVYMIEVIFQRPDSYKFTIYDEKEPLTGIIYHENKGYSIDYRTAEIKLITGLNLEKLKIMLALGHPDNDFDGLFPHVELSEVTMDNVDYYKITCRTDLPNALPFYIYVNKETSRVQRLEAGYLDAEGNVADYVSEVLEYQNWNKVILPMLTKITEGERESYSQVIFFQLNPSLSDQTFELPEFDPVMMRVKQQKTWEKKWGRQ